MTHSLETRRKISLAKMGHYVSDESRAKMSRAHKGVPRPWAVGRSLDKNKGENNTKWKGDSVGYRALHYWIRGEFGPPSECEISDETCKGRFEWANIGGYTRDRVNWKSMCCSHHRRYDMRKKS